MNNTFKFVVEDVRDASNIVDLFIEKYGVESVVEPSSITFSPVKRNPFWTVTLTTSVTGFNSTAFSSMLDPNEDKVIWDFEIAKETFVEASLFNLDIVKTMFDFKKPPNE